MLSSNNSTQERPPGYIYFDDTKSSHENHVITGVQLFNGSLQPVEQLATWEPARIRIHFHSSCSVANGSVILRVQTTEGASLLLCSTEPDAGHPYSITPGRHYADCVFDSWPLSAGKYLLGAGLAIPMVDYLCRQDTLCELHTVGRDVYRSGMPPSSDRYLVASNYHWETQTDAEGVA